MLKVIFILFSSYDKEFLCVVNLFSRDGSVYQCNYDISARVAANFLMRRIEMDYLI